MSVHVQWNKCKRICVKLSTGRQFTCTVSSLSYWFSLYSSFRVLYDVIFRRIRILETKVTSYENQTGGSIELESTSRVQDPVCTRRQVFHGGSAYDVPGVDKTSFHYHFQSVLDVYAY